MRAWIVMAAICGPAAAAPKLRLSTSALVWWQGSSATETVCAFNAGDGTLALSASVGSGVKWLTVSVGAPQTCLGDGRLSTPLRFTVDASSLPWGTYTAVVTVSDPHAIDAPQTVTATVLVNGGDPVAVDQYLAPGAQTDVALQTEGCPSSTVSTRDGVAWLSVVQDSRVMGTLGFRYTVCYGIRIHLAPAASIVPGTYSGSVAVNDILSPRTIPVTMRVTTLPIAVPSVKEIRLRLAEGGPAMEYPFLPPITLSNSGMGGLEVQGVTAAGEGISAYQDGRLAVVTVGPGSRTPGIYNDASVTIQCNGANCPVQVPVRLEVVPRGPPAIAYQSVVDNATFSPYYPVAPGDVCILRGEQLSFCGPVPSAGFPLPTGICGATVRVNNVAAPLFYGSFGQIAFQMPYDTATGTALVQVERGGQVGNTVTVNVVALAPQLLVVTDTAYQLRDATHPAKAGETLILWAIGLGATNPPVAAGAAAPTKAPAVAVSVPQVVFSYGTMLAPTFAGLSPGSAGLYQLIVTVPATAPKGAFNVGLYWPDWNSAALPLTIQ